MLLFASGMFTVLAFVANVFSARAVAVVKVAVRTLSESVMFGTAGASPRRSRKLLLLEGAGRSEAGAGGARARSVQGHPAAAGGPTAS